MELSEMQLEGVTHRWTDDDASIEIADFEGSLRVLHLSDTHVTCSGDEDRKYREYSARMDEAFAQTRRHDTGETTTPIQCLEDALRLGAEGGVDMLVLTGDIVNNPSATSVARVRGALDDSGIDYYYISGNHDWHYEGMDGSPEALRSKWRSDRLLPLYRTEPARTHPGHYTFNAGGMLFVAIDNSTYQIDEEQLESFRHADATGLPLILLLHIPLSVADMPNMLCGHPDWGAKCDENYLIERRQRWPEDGNTRTTEEFVRNVAAAPNLVAILAGHTHSPKVACLEPKLFPGTVHPKALQYVVRSGAHGGQRMIDIVPMHAREEE